MYLKSLSVPFYLLAPGSKNTFWFNNDLIKVFLSIFLMVALSNHIIIRFLGVPHTHWGKKK
jgi:hypothetical protein